MDENKLEVDENIKANQVISRRLKFMKTCSIFLAYFGMVIYNSFFKFNVRKPNCRFSRY